MCKLKYFSLENLAPGVFSFSKIQYLGDWIAVAESDKTMSKKHFWWVSQLSQFFNDNHFNEFSVKGGLAQFPELKCLLVVVGCNLYIPYPPTC